MISQATIDNVFETARVEEVIGDFVVLKKSGSNFKGLSPFSDERTPSFMVSPAKQLWKDFSSGKGGSVVSFLMEHEHFSYPEAIKYLANKYGIEVEETERTDEQKEKATQKENLFIVSDYAKEYFHKTLLNVEEGKAIGLSYFKERGFTQKTIEKFSLGYSLDKWDAFTNTAIKKGYQLEFLEKTGLTIVKGEKQFDRFKGRVVFPIQSMSGRTLGFGGRILTNDKKAAKYLNSPESDIYHKSDVLYGLYQAKSVISKDDNCYLVEGYTDVLQFNQSGIINVVSSSGTALTPNQIRLINRLTKNITVLYDGDDAGLRASIRGIDLILEQGMNVKVCTFPEGEDPDSFAKNNSIEVLKEYLNENSKDFISFKANLLVKEADNDPIKKANTVHEIITSISKIPDDIKKEIYIQECSRLMNIEESTLYSSLAQKLKKQNKELSKKLQKKNVPFNVISSEKQSFKKVDHQFELEKKIIELLLIYGVKEEEFEEISIDINDEGEISHTSEIIKSKVFEKIYLDLQEDETEFANDNFKEMYQLIIEEFNTYQNFKAERLIRKLPPEKAELITHILFDSERYELHNWIGQEIYVKDKNQTISQVVSETIFNLRRYLISMKINELAQDIKNLKDESLKKETLKETFEYTALKKLLSDKLNRVL
ncbi:DNA primase [bacterium]|nr:DNA primase [Flavobacteriaceae bacterium]MDB9780232.1 DNA primase [bacterium]